MWLRTICNSYCMLGSSSRFLLEHEEIENKRQAGGTLYMNVEAFLHDWKRFWWPPII